MVSRSIRARSKSCRLSEYFSGREREQLRAKGGYLRASVFSSGFLQCLPCLTNLCLQFIISVRIIGVATDFNGYLSKRPQSSVFERLRKHKKLRWRNHTMTGRSFMARLLLAGLCLFLGAAAPVFADDWKPIDPAHLAMKGPAVEKDADAEVIFWE